MIPFSNRSLYYAGLTFIALSGLGVVFLNEESILALCFFVFLFLVIRNSDALTLTLDDLRQSIRSELVHSLIEGSTQILKLRTLTCDKKRELLNSTSAMTFIAIQKAKAIQVTN